MPTTKEWCDHMQELIKTGDREQFERELDKKEDELFKFGAAMKERLKELKEQFPELFTSDSGEEGKKR